MSHRDDTQDPNDPDGRRKVAVALSYELGGPNLPKVVATGRGAVADQILELAFRNGIRVREDGDLAEILSAVEVDSEIPAEAIVAVAEILSYLYRAGRLKRHEAGEDTAQ